MGITRSNPLGISLSKKPFKVKNSRGRPKQHRESVDQGTAELRAKKMILAGGQDAFAPQRDLSQTLYLLYYRKALTGPQYKAGQAYRLLWDEVCRFWGLSSLKGSSTERWGQGRGSYSPWDQAHHAPVHKEHLLRRWERLQRLLAQEDATLQHLMFRVIIENYITPAMLQEEVPPPPDLKRLQKGLDLLQRFFNG